MTINLTRPTLLIIAAFASPLVAQQRAEQAYAQAVPDLVSIQCNFDPVANPAVAATTIDITRSKTEDNWYLWRADNSALIVPILAIYRNPKADEPPLTSVISPDLGGMVGMISYAPSGNAMLSKHHMNADGKTSWTTQIGQCTETKGS